MQEQDPTLGGLIIAFVILFVVFRRSSYSVRGSSVCRSCGKAF